MLHTLFFAIYLFIYFFFLEILPWADLLVLYGRYGTRAVTSKFNSHHDHFITYEVSHEISQNSQIKDKHWKFNGIEPHSKVVII